MYPEVPYNGLSWPVTQHAGVLKADVFEGLLNACLLCKGQVIDAGKINSYLVKNNILTANIRSDSKQIDAWRDYQQILSEFGLIYSTRITKILTLTPVAMAYLNRSLSYKEVITLQLLRYQYPNGHKSQLSKSLVQSYGSAFNYESYTAMQAAHGILLRPAVLIWRILNDLWSRGQQVSISLEELQRYIVRCVSMGEYKMCSEAIIQSRHGNTELMPLDRARRNMSDWMKLLGQTLLFKLNAEGDTLVFSPYSIRERSSVETVCRRLSEPETYWIYEENTDYKKSWFDFYGDYDSSIEFVLKEGGNSR